MPKVTAYQNEPFERLISRFKKLVDREDTLKDYHKKDFYEKPSSIRKHAKAAAKKRWERKSKENQLPNHNRLY